MKKILFCMLVASGAIYATPATQESITEFNILVVPQIKDEAVQKFQNRLTKQMRAVNIATPLVYGAGAAGIGYMLYRMFLSDDNSYIRRSDLDGLRRVIINKGQEQAELKRRVDALAAGTPAVTSWAPWLSTQVSGAASTIGSWIPAIIKGFAYQQAASVFYRQFPSIGNFLSTTPSVDWAMLSGTHFVTTIQQFHNWFGVTLNNPQRPVDLKLFAVCGHQLVTEIEKVIGYMHYIQNQLKPDSLVLKARSETCIEGVYTEMKELIPVMNGFIADGTGDPQVTVGMLQYWIKSMFGVITHLENFDLVAQAVGYKGREGIFNYLKKNYLPAGIPTKPEGEEETEEDMMVQQMMAQGMQVIAEED